MKNRLRHAFAQDSHHLALHKISFCIVRYTWSAACELLSAMNVDADTLREALRQGHGIEFGADEDPSLFFVLDSEMRQKLWDANFREPTDAQLVATARCVGMSENDAREKFSAQYLGDN